MIPRGLGDRIKGVLERSRSARRALVLGLALVVVAAIYFGVAVPLVHRFNRASLPDFPDCTGRPAVVTEYLNSAYGQAMDRPTSDEAVGQLGMAFHAHLFYDPAATCYSRAEELNPSEWKWSYFAGLLHEERGDTKATIAALSAVVRKQPECAQAWFRLGNSYLKSQSFEEADSAFRQVLKLAEAAPLVISGVRVPAEGSFPLRAYARLQLARSQVQQRRFADAQSVLGEVITAYPTFGPAYRLLGTVYHDLGDEPKAADYEIRAGDFESYVPPADVMYNVLVLNSRDVDFIRRQMDVAVKWENYDWTMSLINRILEFSPLDGDALTFKIKLALDTQKLGDLVLLVKAYAGQFKADEPKLLDMARYLRMRGEYEASVALLRDIITLNPRAMDAHIEFARMLQTFKQYDMGIGYCNEVIAKDSSNPQMRAELVDLLIHEGKLDKAATELRIAEGLHLDDETRFILLGRMAEKKGDRGVAVRCFQKALAANPRNSATQIELGRLYLAHRMWNEASSHWQSALRGSPNNVDFIVEYTSLLAACPDARIRDGGKALDLAGRLKLAKKQTMEQEIRCGIALAAAYAEMRQFAAALSVARDYLEHAHAARNSEYARELEAFVKLFESGKPYRL